MGDGNVGFALTDMSDIGKYVAQIIADPRTINRHVLAYTEVLSMNEIWDVMARASGEVPPKDYVRSSQTKNKNTRGVQCSPTFTIGAGGGTPRYHRRVSEEA